MKQVAILGLLLACFSTHGEVDHKLTQEQLKKLQTDIRRLQIQLDQDRSQADQLQESLHDNETTIGRLTLSLRQFAQETQQHQKQLEATQAQFQAEKQRLQNQQSLLAQQLYQLNTISDQTKLKLLLNINDPALMGRLLVYYDYFNQARLKELHELHQTLQAIHTLENAAQNEIDTLNELQEATQAQHQRLKAQKKQREQILAALQTRMNDNNQAIELKQQDAERLEKLLAGIEKSVRKLPLEAPHGTLATLKGQLPLPLVQPAPTHRKARGILIESTPGQEVTAVAAGRVAFSDWLRGYGLLLILDHGHGYMSLYGHNQSLFKATGDWIEPGEVIALVGESGGAGEAGLYFEIRHNGQPEDVMIWCKSAPLGKTK